MQIHWLFFLIPDINPSQTSWPCNRRGTGKSVND